MVGAQVREVRIGNVQGSPEHFTGGKRLATLVVLDSERAHSLRVWRAMGGK